MKSAFPLSGCAGRRSGAGGCRPPPRARGCYIVAPAMIQESIVEIWAVVKQARGFVLVVEHMLGIRPSEQPVTFALMIWLITLVLGLLGTTRVMVLQDAIVFVPFGFPFTMRANSPESLTKLTCGPLA